MIIAVKLPGHFAELYDANTAAAAARPRGSAVIAAATTAKSTAEGESARRPEVDDAKDGAGARHRSFLPVATVDTKAAPQAIAVVVEVAAAAAPGRACSERQGC